jgi:hypothetical protein
VPWPASASWITNAWLNTGSVSVFNRDLRNFPEFLSFAGSTVQTLDAFATHNRFYGGQIGLDGKWWPEEWILMELGVKLGIGATSEELRAPSDLMYHELGVFGSLGPVTEDWSCVRIHGISGSGSWPTATPA